MQIFMYEVVGSYLMAKKNIVLFLIQPLFNHVAAGETRRTLILGEKVRKGIS